MRTMHICRLGSVEQTLIYAAIMAYLRREFPELDDHEITCLADEAMCGRLCDLEEGLDLEALGL